MDRYADNVSPEPTSSTNTSTSSAELSSLSLLSGCYKTPEGFQHYNTSQFSQYSQINPTSSVGFYPTPTSDSEDSSTLPPPPPPYQYGGHVASITPLTSTIPQNLYYNNASINENNANTSTSSSASSINEEAAVNRQLYKDDNVENGGKRHPLKEIEIIFAPVQEPLDKKGARYKRRTRTCFSQYQLDVLEQTFQKYNYPEIHVVDKLCDELNLKQERICIWFQNRRARNKKSKKLEAKEAKENHREQLLSRPAAATTTTNVPTTSTSFPATTATTYQTYLNTPAPNTFYNNMSAYQQSTPTTAYYPSNMPTTTYYHQFYQYPSFYQAPNSDVYSSQVAVGSGAYVPSTKQEEN